MKQNVKITLCGITVALSVVFMLLSYFPYFTYAIPAITGLLTMMLVIEINVKWAFAAYVAASVLVFIFAEPESKLMYICLFGYYPIIKALIERINKPVIEWVLKLVVFNAAVLLIYVVFAGMFGISLDDFNVIGKYGVYIFWAFGNAVFVLYDITVSRLSGTYMYRIHPKVKKLLRI
ncbi:MAG: hypothetical protein UHO61_01195 [Acutalibacteraceae bacterium]|nr:hypothetical protein [Acutalibacteraceae bacterium]